MDEVIFFFPTDLDVPEENAEREVDLVHVVQYVGGLVDSVRYVTIVGVCS